MFMILCFRVLKFINFELIIINNIGYNLKVNLITNNF